MGPRSLALVLLLLIAGLSVSASPAAAFTPRAGDFSVALPEGTNGTLLAVGTLQMVPQDLANARFLVVPSLYLTADEIRTTGPDLVGVAATNASLAATASEASLTNASVLRVELAPVTGRAALRTGNGTIPGGAPDVATGFLSHLHPEGGVYTFNGDALRLVLFNATGVNLTSEIGPTIPGSASRLIVEATGNVSLTLTGARATLAPASQPLRVIARAPLAVGAAPTAALLPSDVLSGPCAGVAARYPPEGLVSGPGLFLLTGTGNATSIHSEAGAAPAEACSYLRIQLVTLAVGGESARADGAALWIHAVSAIAPAEGRRGLGPIPLAAILVWSVAVVVVAYPRLKREPTLAKADHPLISTRIPPQRIALALHLVVLLVTLAVWDHACFVRYGTSLGSTLLVSGFSMGALQAFLVPEILPWVLSVVAFGIPGFLAARAFLTALGAGPAYRGACMAMGHITVALLGPAHLVFWLDLLARYGLAGA